jgi:hypothetical protein
MNVRVEINADTELGEKACKREMLMARPILRF